MHAYKELQRLSQTESEPTDTSSLDIKAETDQLTLVPTQATLDHEKNVLPVRVLHLQTTELHFMQFTIYGDDEKWITNPPTMYDVLYTLLFMLVVFYAHTITLGVVTMRTTDPAATAPMRDIYTDISPRMHVHWINNCNIALHGLFVATLILFQIKENMHRYAIMIHIGLTWATMLMIRTVTITVTSAPEANNYCQLPENRRIDNLMLNAFALLIGMGSVGRHCSDLIFSGHTVILYLLVLAIQTYSRVALVRWLSLALLPVSVWSMVVSRNHYTLDVFLSIVLTTLVWKLAPRKFPRLNYGFLSYLNPTRPVAHLDIDS